MLPRQRSLMPNDPGGALPKGDDPVNSNQRLFVTPEERARRLSEQGRHPHGGEGNCGGNEGHGTPELQRQNAAKQGSGATERVKPARDNRNQAADKGKPNAPTATAKPAEQPAVKKANSEALSNGQVLTREKIVSAMKLSFALGEPACRRYGMPTPFRRHG